MAKNGRKLELYEILAAKRAKGKMPLGIDSKQAKQANSSEQVPEEITDAPGVIIDDAVGSGIGFVKPDKADQKKQPEPDAEPERRESLRETKVEPPQTAVREPEPIQQESRPPRRDRSVRPTPEYQEPAPEPRPKSPREVVFALDTALIFFTVVLALIGSSYFIGYKRGQEERPAGLAGVSEIEITDPNRLNIRTLSPAPRAAVRPPETDYTLIIRKEPASDDLPERLELELSEALIRGRREAGRDFPGFIFRTGGNDPHYILAVGLGQSANDQELNRLLQIYNVMEGINLSRQPRPYLGCRIAPIRELGTPVY